MMADDTEVESVTAVRQRMTRDRDDDHPAGTWSTVTGEFVDPPTANKRTGRMEAEDWVETALRLRASA